MTIFRTKIWNWWDVWMLKWCAFLFGIAAGACFSAYVAPYLWIILAAAIILAIRPALAYFRD